MLYSIARSRKPVKYSEIRAMSLGKILSVVILIVLSSRERAPLERKVYE